MIGKWKQKASNYLAEAIKLNLSPTSIALGFSIGSWIAIIPTPGANILLCTLVAMYFKSVNKLSLFGALAFWNPLTMIPIYVLSYKIGEHLFGVDATSILGDGSLFDKVLLFIEKFLVGNLILATVISVALYFLVKFMVTRYQTKPPVELHEEEVIAPAELPPTSTDLSKNE